MLKNFQENLLDNLIIRGIKNIKKVVLRKIANNIKENEGKFDKEEYWVLDTVGTNMLDILALSYIDKNRTYSNDIQEIYRVLGIEAARQSIFNEISEVIEFDGTYINFHHLTMLCDRMCCNDKMVSVFRHGINNDDIGPIAKASFEETPEMFLKAARHGELDNMKGVSSNIMCGQEGYYGTSSFQVMLDLQEVIELNKSQEQTEIQKKTSDEDFINKEFGEMEDNETLCSLNNLSINVDINNLKTTDMGKNDSYDPGF
jgi:DNA-directed RNA polymerase II subunit RPB1